MHNQIDAHQNDDRYAKNPTQEVFAHLVLQKMFRCVDSRQSPAAGGRCISRCRVGEARIRGQAGQSVRLATVRDASKALRCATRRDLISQIEINGIAFCEHPRRVDAAGGACTRVGVPGGPRSWRPRTFAAPSHERVAAAAEQTGDPLRHCATQNLAEPRHYLDFRWPAVVVERRTSRSRSVACR